MVCHLPLATLLLAGFWTSCCGIPDSPSYNILVFLPAEIKSHFNGFKPLLEALVARGHNLTLVSPFTLGPANKGGPPLSYTHIPVEITAKGSGVDFLDKNSVTNRLPQYLYMTWLGPMMARNALDKPAVRRFLADGGGGGGGDDRSYALVLVSNFYHECFAALGRRYGAPVAQLVPFAANARVSQWHSNPYGPAYIADFGGPYAAPAMTTTQRADNVAAAAFGTFVGRLAYMPRQRDLAHRHFGGAPAVPLDDALRGVSLTLVNSHPLVGSVAPFVPGFVLVAGMHVEPVAELPRDLKTILDTAENGVVYFSLGSVIKSSKMPRETASLLLSELAKLNQTVLWKWEDDRLPDLPSNVIVQKWFPQNDILAHPNCRLFITHGGIHSLIESIYHGVPMLSIPVFGDQTHNSVEAESRGFALYISYFDLTAETFGSKLQSLLQEPRFKEAVVKASAIMRDNPISIMDKAIFWIEYVIRHDGAPHLRTAANDLYWFEYYLLDVISTIVMALAFVSFLTFKCCSYMLRKVFFVTGSKTKEQ